MASRVGRLAATGREVPADAAHFKYPPDGEKHDLDPEGHWRTVQGQPIHITGSGEIDAGGHPELRKALEEKAGLKVKAPAAAPPPAPAKAKATDGGTPGGPRAEVTEGGRTFRTGEPVTFPYIRNTQKAPPALKGGVDRYQQKVEPAGRYLSAAATGGGGGPPPGWDSGSITFRNPLVVPLNSGGGDDIYDDNSWKKNLSREFGNKTGAALSAAAGLNRLIDAQVRAAQAGNGRHGGHAGPGAFDRPAVEAAVKAAVGALKTKKDKAALLAHVGGHAGDPGMVRYFERLSAAELDARIHKATLGRLDMAARSMM
jgi:hypothetical protein